ncbi:MAG TPA: hypothetical protein VGC38_03535 [Pseudolabrys sp.]
MAVALCVVSCAIHPLPENVTPYDTNNIVFHIRCEARDAVKNATIKYLLNPSQPFGDATREEGRKLAEGGRFEDLDFRRLDPRPRFFLTKYQATAIAYDFTFDITEDNAAGGNVNFLSQITNGTVGLAAGVATDRQRETIRNFRVTDTFGGLRMLSACEGPDTITAGDYIYPIAGKVGLEEMVMTFVNLNEHENLAPAKTAALDSAEAFAAADTPTPTKKAPTKPATATASAKVSTLADTFNFTTTITGTLTPTLTITPVAHFSRLNLTQATMPLSASRKDIHKLVIALSVGNTACAPNSGLLLSSPISKDKTPAENCALREIDNQKTINSLNSIKQ